MSRMSWVRSPHGALNWYNFILSLQSEIAMPSLFHIEHTIDTFYVIFTIQNNNAFALLLRCNVYPSATLFLAMLLRILFSFTLFQWFFSFKSICINHRHVNTCFLKFYCIPSLCKYVTLCVVLIEYRTEVFSHRHRQLFFKATD